MTEVAAMSITVPLTLIGVSVIITTMSQVMSIGDEIREAGVARVESNADTMLQSQINQYDNRDKTGVEIASAITTFSRDYALVIWNIGMDDKEGCNYGRLLKGASNSNKTEYKYSDSNKVWTIKYDSGDFTRKDGNSFYNGEILKESDGMIKKNPDTAGTKQKACVQFIANNATYHSWLIKDKRGETVGILAVQQD